MAFSAHGDLRAGSHPAVSWDSTAASGSARKRIAVQTGRGADSRHDPAEQTVATSRPPRDQGTSPISSTLVTTRSFGYWSAGRGDAQISPQEALQKYPVWRKSGAAEAKTVELLAGLPAWEFWIFPNTTLSPVRPHHSLWTGLRSSCCKTYLLLQSIHCN